MLKREKASIYTNKRRHVETPKFIDGLIQAEEVHDQFATDLGVQGKLRNTHH